MTTVARRPATTRPRALRVGSARANRRQGRRVFRNRSTARRYNPGCRQAWGARHRRGPARAAVRPAQAPPTGLRRVGLRVSSIRGESGLSCPGSCQIRLAGPGDGGEWHSDGAGRKPSTARLDVRSPTQSGSVIHNAALLWASVTVASGRPQRAARSEYGAARCTGLRVKGIGMGSGLTAGHAVLLRSRVRRATGWRSTTVQ